MSTDLTNLVTTKLGELRHEALAAMRDLKSTTGGRLDRLEAALLRPDAPGGSATPRFMAGFKTPAESLLEQKDLFELFGKTGHVRFPVGQFFPHFPENKTLVDSAALGFSTPGILGADRIQGIVPLPRRRLTVRDLLRARPTDSAQIEWIRETAFTNAASPQAEGNDKAESANTFTIASAKVSTIAHWIPLTRQVLDDLPELRRFVNDNLMYGLKLKEETEILAGDGLGDHLNGIITQASAYAGTYAVGGDTKLDTLRHAILELENADEQASGFVLHPIDFHDVELIKDENGGANTGRYVVGDPLGGSLTVPTLWGRPVVVTRSIASGRFLAGNFQMAELRDRMDSTIDLSEEHSDFFVKNKVAIRAEERIALAVMRTTAFTYGSF